MKKLKMILLVFLVSVCAFAQEENTVLWSVNGNGLEKTSYLFGTIHLACPEDLKLSEKVVKALSETEQLGLELDMTSPSFRQDMQAVSLNPGMKNISGLLSKEELAVLNRFFKEYYFADLSRVGVLKPFVLMSMVIAKGMECEKPDSIESLLIAYVKKHDMEVNGLETIKEQVDVFDQVEQKEQLKWLLDCVKDMEGLRAEMKNIQELYQKEEAAKIFDLTIKQPEFVTLKKPLLDDRNNKWIPLITKQATEKATFFAVGAAHLISDNGLVSLLRKKGYIVSPVLE